MAVKFAFTAERVADACTIPEYLGVLTGRVGSVIAILPKMMVDEDGKYIVEVVHDEDGDIVECKNVPAAIELLDKVPPRRIEAMSKQIVAACREIINPTKGGDSAGPSPKEPPPPRGGS